jgi:hypothetical protein
MSVKLFSVSQNAHCDTEVEKSFLALGLFEIEITEEIAFCAVSSISLGISSEFEDHDLLYYNRPVQKCNLSDRRRALVYGRFLGILFILSFCQREFFSFK